MKHLSVDLETYSSVDIKKAGLYKYVQSPDFMILLFAYSIDYGPVRIVDFVRGECVPPEVLLALDDPGVIKHAYNAAFEWYCLNKFGQSPLEQWRCTMLHGLYCGYTASLEATGKALGLPQEKQKLMTGRRLIKIFCTPTKPSNANGNRTRTWPKHEPEKWELFKAYCVQDVVTEMEIERRLSAFPVPEEIQAQWVRDQKQNAFGVALDVALVQGALAVDAMVKAELTQEAKELTGLANPNSAAQLKPWLEKQLGQPVENLQKETVAGLLDEIKDQKAKRMLQLRQEMSKTSVKKYAAMEAARCEDGRVRGLMQFYGANRTGRWCLTGDHEVLTPNGWVRLDCWEGGKIACWNATTEAASFQKANKLEFAYGGPMYYWESQRISQICTPDHKMPVWNRRGFWDADLAENLATKSFELPFTAVRNTNPSLEHIELRILIMTQADGHYTEGGDLRFHFRKERKIERCKSLLRKARITYFEGNDTNASTIVVKSRNMPIWLRAFREKNFGMWMLDESADVIFEELEYWDAYRCGPNSIQYSSTNKNNVDVLQALAHLSGRTATIIERKREERWSPAYALNIWLTPGPRTLIRKRPEKIPFSGIVYCAETTTGFFMVRRNGKVWVTGNSGRLVQLQNLTKNRTEILDFARQLVKEQKTEAIKVIFGGVPDLLSQLIRTCFIAEPGKKIISADFSAIEARVLSWLAQEGWRLEVFRTHGKIYEASASAMFGVPLEYIVKGRPEYALRQKGKVAELALGYQGASGALVQMGALKMGLTEEELPDIVRKWRQTNNRIVDFWYRIDRAAISVLQEGRPVGLAGLTLQRECDFDHGQDFFTIRLPSGRKLFYAHPFLSPNQWGNDSLHYYGMNQTTRKWEAQDTYGGKLTENVVQAIARDCLAEALTRLEAAGHQVVFTVHDEAILEVPEHVTVEEVCSIMSRPVPWAPGLDLPADGFESPYYKKD